MYIRLLGRLRLQGKNGDIPLVGPVSRGIVGRLLMARGDTVQRDALIDDVWGRRQARHPVNALHVQVSKLRAAFASAGEGDRLVSAHGGYRLVLESHDQIDAVLFETTVREAHVHLEAGDFRKAEERLLGGLALWNGGALDDLEGLVFDAERARLEELQLGAVENAATAALGYGAATHLVPELRALVASDPLREPARARLMLALYRSGRHAEALQVYEDGRRRLDEELGALPSAELRRLHTAVLSHSPSLQGPVALAETGDGGASAPQHATHWTHPETTGGTGTSQPSEHRPEPSPPGSAQKRPEGNLGRPLGPFVGRHNELETLHRAVIREHLITVVGPGGVGKTRLALEACALVQSSFETVWWVDLTSADRTKVLASVASTLGLSDASVRPGEPPNDYVRRLVSILAGRRVLLALDNCEHLLDEVAPLVLSLLGQCSSLTVLITSREPLAVTGEVLHPLAPMPEEDAADLFSTRAVMIDPGFATDEIAIRQVRELCRRLDGLPLAVELAAAHVRLLPVHEITARLDNRFSLLSRGGRGAPARHRTLRAVLDWSYTLLNEDERLVLTELSLYVGGCSLDEARRADLGGLSDDSDLLSVLARLVDKSLLFPMQTATESRLRMLDTVREYAQGQLAKEDWAGAGEERFISWAMRLVREGTTGMSSATQTDWARKLTAESANIRAASGLLISRGREVESLLLEARLGYYWFFSGREEEGIEQLRRSLAAYDATADRSDEPTSPDEEWAVFYTFAWLGWLNHVAGRHADAAACITRHTSAWHEARHPDLAVLGPCYDTLHSMLNGRQDLHEMFRIAEEKVSRTDFHWERAVLQTNWSTYCLQQGDATAARERGLIAVAASRAAEDDFARAFSLTLCGDADESDGLHANARLQWAEAARILRPMGARPRWAYAMLRLIFLDVVEGRSETAADSLAAVTAVADELSSEDLRAATGNLRAMLALGSGTDVPEALRLFGTVWESPAAPLDRRAAAGLCMAALVQDADAARDLIDRARKMYGELVEPLARRAVGVMLSELDTEIGEGHLGNPDRVLARLADSPSLLAAFC
ncbi:NB-ARC domain-containing protein (plasmid) [Streptomyces globisporus]|uniref:AfsR/SARP family transcriptional regulator n=1 Tax=Streptomyces globisporus TaxID=1908 RepID=UPI002F916C62|nr:NB-ARC domain-containing protein [Streptomyces globisporus]